MPSENRIAIESSRIAAQSHRLRGETLDLLGLGLRVPLFLLGVKQKRLQSLRHSVHFLSIVLQERMIPDGPGPLAAFLGEFDANFFKTETLGAAQFLGLRPHTHHEDSICKPGWNHRLHVVQATPVLIKIHNQHHVSARIPIHFGDVSFREFISNLGPTTGTR